MSDRFLEQRINIKSCVKLGKNTCDTCAMFAESYGGEIMKMFSVSEWHRWFKQSSHMETINEGNSHHFLRYQGYFSL
jgi:hypothetical protein